MVSVSASLGTQFVEEEGGGGRALKHHTAVQSGSPGAGGPEAWAAPTRPSWLALQRPRSLTPRPPTTTIDVDLFCSKHVNYIVKKLSGVGGGGRLILEESSQEVGFLSSLVEGGSLSYSTPMMLSHGSHTYIQLDDWVRFCCWPRRC